MIPEQKQIIVLNHVDPQYDIPMDSQTRWMKMDDIGLPKRMPHSGFQRGLRLHECPDWNWCYKYHYPPLLKDLLIFIPHFKTNFIEIKSPNPISQIDQLKYVLPKSHLDLLPENVYEEIKDSDWYSNDFEFKWAFCRYIWESHILF